MRTAYLLYSKQPDDNISVLLWTSTWISFLWPFIHFVVLLEQYTPWYNGRRTCLTPTPDSSYSIYYQPIFHLTLPPLSLRQSKSCYIMTLIYRKHAINFLLLPPRARAYYSKFSPSAGDSLSFHSSTSSPLSHRMVHHFQVDPIRRHKRCFHKLTSATSVVSSECT
jgi:hypothetical protein